jgi:hypothetical protein
LIKVEGLTCAQQIEIKTTTDCNDIYKIKDLNMILKLKHDEVLSSILEQVDLERIELN